MLSPQKHLASPTFFTLMLTTGLFTLLLPQFLGAQCGAGETYNSYCYDNGLSDEVAFQFCPVAGQIAESSIIQGSFNTNLPDNLTVYSGSSGSGTTGTIVFGPDDGNLLGEVIEGNAADDCLIFVINSNQIGIDFSCADGTESELQVCSKGIAPPTSATLSIAPDNFCSDDGVQVLDGGAPAGGMYSGTGVSDNGDGTFDFNPNGLGGQTITITYEVTSTTATDNITVTDAGSTTFTAPGNLCIDAGIQTSLSGGAPGSGSYSGPGVTDNGDGTFDFNPGVAGLGVHTLSYTDNGVCEATVMEDVEVLAACGCPVGQTSYFYCYENNETNTVAFEVCPDAGQAPKATITAGTIGANIKDSDVLNVYSGASGSTNTGTLVSGPLAGDVAGTLINGPLPDECLIFVINSGNLGSCADGGVSANETGLAVCGESVAPQVNIVALDDLCINAGVQTNLSGGNPAGGTYSGPGVTDNMDGTYDFDPAAAGVGVHTITYTVSGEEGTDVVEVFESGIVDFTALADLCVDAGVQNDLSGGTPEGGSFSGPGVTDNGDGTYDFNPGIAGVGTHTISYTQPGGCQETAMGDVQVTEACGCPTGEISRFACFGNDQPEGTIFQICPDAGEIVQASFTGGSLGVDDELTVYEGSIGMSNIVYGPQNGPLDLSDVNDITGVVTDACLIFVLSTGPVSSCADGFEKAIQVCGRSVVPSLGFTAPADLGVDAGFQIGLSGGTPSGGVYSGPGVIDDGNGTTYSFDPESAGIGVHTLTYTVNGDMVSDDIEVFDVEPEFSAEFFPGTIGPGGSSRLVFTISNNSSPNPVEELTFTNNLPAGLVIADAPGLASTCLGGTLTGPAGGGTVSFSDGALAAGSSCTLSVNVTSGTTGSFTNVSGDLTSDRGNSGTANDNLTVADNRPGFYKAFSPATIDFGQTSRLTLTIDNSLNGSNVFNINYTDQLPDGMLIASPANLENTCIQTPTISADRTTISAFGNFLTGGADCTVAFDVITALGASNLENVTDVLTSSSGDGGFATATLNINQPSTDILLQKSFVDNPVGPGDEVDLTFTITNLNRGENITDITFTDDLDAMLSGLVAVGLPQDDVCGAGSSLSGTSSLTLTGGNLVSGGSCTFTVTLQVPANAATGTYPNTTSTITANTQTGPVTGDPAAADLLLKIVPQVTKTFSNEEVVPGSTVDLTFNLTNPSGTETITDIEFTDELTEFLPGVSINTMTMLPMSSCGGSVNQTLFSNALTLILNGGQLAPDEDCSFTVTLNIPEDTPGGLFTNTTSLISSTVSGETNLSTGATDDLTVLPAPRITKSILEGAVLPGETATVEFTLDYSDQAIYSATGISFTDDLDAFLSGTEVSGSLPVAPCGAGSSLSGTSTLTLTGGQLEPGGSCTFQVTVMVPAGALPGTYTNSTSEVSSMINGMNATSPAGTDQLVISGLDANLTVLKNPVVPGDLTTLEFSFENVSSVDISNMFFTLSLSGALSGMSSQSGTQNDVVGMGSQVTGTTTLVFTGGNLSVGESASFTVDVSIPPAANDGQYLLVSSVITADFDGVGAVLEPLNTVLEVQSELIGLEKEFMPSSTVQGGNIDVVYTLTNLNDNYDLTNIAFMDDFDAVLSGLAATGLPASVCGGTVSGTGIITLTGGSLSAGGDCSFTVTLQLPDGIGGTFTSTTSVPAGETVAGSLPVSGNAASDDFKVEAVNLEKSFLNTPIEAGQTTTLEFTLTNNGDSPVNGLSFTDDLSSMATGLVAVGLPAADICGAGSSISGTGLLTFSGGTLPVGGSCTFSVTVAVPCDLEAGTYTNTTSDLFSSGLSVGEPATDNLETTPEQVDPEIECPDPITIECDESTDPANTGLASASDECFGTLTPTYEDANMLTNGLGTIDRTWTAEDGAGNTNDCVQVITLEDTTNPIFSSFPADAEVECGQSTEPAATGIPVVSDNCSSPNPVYEDGAFSESCSSTGSFQRTWSAMDLAGNPVMQVQMITIVDNTDPIFSQFPDDITVECGQSTEPSATGTPMGSDVCGTVNITYDDQFAEDCGNTGILTRTWTITDECGNSHEREQVITIEDTTPPSLDCPDDISVGNDPGACGAVVTYAAQASDACGDVMISYGIEPGTLFEVGETMVEVNATDACGLMATSCTFKVTVNDTEDPTANCPGNIIQPNDPGQCSATVNFTLPDATDNCTGATQSANAVSGQTFSVGTTTVTVTATDAASNSASCTFDVTINDTEAPTANCPGNIIQPSDPGQCGASISFTLPDATDNCTGATQQADANSGQTFPVGSTTVTVTATDAASNTASCTFEVTVNDTEGPTANCPGNITQPNDPGQCSASVSFTLPDATDNCTGVTQQADANSGQTFSVGTTTVTVTATDAASNSASCTFDVTVNDTEAPVPVCLNTDVLIQPNGSFEVELEDVIDLGASSDNCAFDRAEIDATTINCDEEGSIVPLTVVVYDVAGNTANCIANLTVSTSDDLLPPFQGFDIGQSNNGNDYAYNPCKEQFTIESTARNTTSGNEDDQAFIHVALCGDFTLDARLDSLIGASGYGGLMARESNDPGSRQVSLLSNLTSLLRWEQRQVTNGPKSTILIDPAFPKYLRMVRSGNVILGYSSNTGNTFQLINSAQIGSADCIEAGITAFTNDPSGETRAVFSGVQFDGAVNDCPAEGLILNSNPLIPNTYRTASTITSTGTVAPSTEVTFTAGQSITLQPGFTAAAGATFTARIEDCVPFTSNPLLTKQKGDEPVAENQVYLPPGPAQLTGADRLRVFPNPFNNQATIALHLSEEKPVDIRLFDLNGKLMAHVLPQSVQFAGDHQYTVDGNELSSGVYILVVRAGDNMIKKRLAIMQ